MLYSKVPLETMGGCYNVVTGREMPAMLMAGIFVFSKCNNFVRFPPPALMILSLFSVYYVGASCKVGAVLRE
jgi:hypothetical protein